MPFPGTGVFLGWPLNLVAFILAIVAMAKGGTRKGLMQLVLSLIVSPVVYFVGTVLFVGAAAAVGQQQIDPQKGAQSAELKVAATTAVDEERIEVSAMQYYQDYKANEITANSRYKGKPLLISGTVRSIQSDFMDKPVVTLSAGDFGSVNVMGLPLEDAGALSKGDRVQLACIGNGQILASPIARDCSRH